MRLNILITAPSLDAMQNLSGISSVALVITKNCNHCFFHYKLGGKAGRRRGLIWAGSLLYAYLRLPFYLRRHEIDLVHLNIPCNPNGIMRDFFMVWVANLCKKKVVAHLHGGNYMTEKINNRIIASMFNYILNNTSAVIVQSEIERLFLSNTYGFSQAEILSNAIEVGEKKDVAGGEVPNLLYLGRIDKNKGIKEIVSAFTKLYKEMRFRFVLCGDGPDRVGFEEELRNIMGDDFKYCGVVAGEKKTEAILQSEIFILPSYFEGLPMAMLETMGFGLVPVVTSVGSIPLVIEHETNGILVNKKDADDFYLKLKALLNNRELICRLSKQAYNTVKERFNSDKFIARLEEIYEKVLS